MSTNTNKFADEILADLNKDENQVQKESILDILTDYEIQCNTQIGFLKTGSIPQLNLKLEQLKRELAIAKKGLTNSYKDLKDGDFAAYIKNITKAEDAVAKVESQISETESEVTQKEAQIEKFQKLLNKIKGE